MGSLTTVVNQFLDSLWKVGASSLRVSNMSDISQLHQAVKDNKPTNVSLLIEKGADVNLTYQQETAFTRAVEEKSFQCAEVILTSRRFNPNAKNQFDRTPVFVAAKAGRVDYVQKLLDLGARVNDADVRGNTPLSACSWGDHHEAAELLLQRGANVNQADCQGQTPLFRACSNVSVKVVRVLLKHNCDVDQPTLDKETPLMEALPSYYNYHVAGKKISDMLHICEMLVSAGCNLNSQDDKGKTALHLAVEANEIHGLCLLAESGCELNLKDNAGYTPFQTAVLPNRSNYDLARFLLFYGADVTQEMKNPNLSSHNMISPLSLVLNSKPGLQDLDKQWSRALLLRSLWRSVYPASSLIKSCDRHQAVQSLAPDNKENSFQESVEREILEWLNSCVPCSLQHQASLVIRASLGSKDIIPKINLLPIGSGLKQHLGFGLRTQCTPLSRMCRLHLYIKDGLNDKVREIVGTGADFSMPLNNKTPLSLSLEIGNTEAARILLEDAPQQSLSTPVNASGDTALHITAKHGRDDLLDLVIRGCPNLDVRNLKGFTPLQVAIQSGRFTTAGALIQSGADVNVGDLDGIPLIHLAAASGATDVVELLLKKGVNPNTEDKFRNTALHVAASKGNEYLKAQISLPGLYQNEVSAALDAVQMNLTNSLPKYTKCTTGDWCRVVRCLLSHGADPSRLNLRAETPLQCAQRFKAVELLDLLKAKLEESIK